MHLITRAVAGGTLGLFSVSVALASSHAAPRSIAFGEGFKGAKLVHVKNVFPKTKNVAWQARVAKLTGKVTVDLTQTSGPGPHPTVVKSWTQTFKKPVTTVGGMWTVKQMKPMHIGYAVFRLDYRVQKHTIASGSFERLNCTTQCGSGNGTY